MEKPIVVLGPMRCEMEEYPAVMSDVRQTAYGGASFYEGLYRGRPVVAVHCLIGMVNAAKAATLAITRYAPSCVIIQGTAGGHDPRLHQGDIVLGENIIETGSYYTGHREEGEGSSYLEWEFPGEEMPVDGEIRRVRVLHSDEALLKIAEETPYTQGRKVRGTIASGDIWHKEIDKILYFHRVHGSSCEEMENFAVSQVCQSFGVPCLGVRILSNSELHPDETFDEKYGRQLQYFVLALIGSIQIKT